MQIFSRVIAALALACVSASAAVIAAPAQEMNDEQLSEVAGQAIIEMVQTVFTQEPKHFVADWKTNDFNNNWRRLDNPSEIGKLKSRIDPATGRTMEDGYSLDGWPEYYDADQKKMVTLNSPVYFTKMRIGADIEMDVDVGKLYLGGYKWNGGPNTPLTLPDGTANNLERGDWDLKQESIKWTGWREGSTYLPLLGHLPSKTGRYHPFHVKNPYFEIAEQRNNGKREVLGFRFGFEEMDGMFGVNFLRGTGRGFVTSQALGGLATATVNNYGKRAEGDNILLREPGLLAPLLALVPSITNKIFPVIVSDKGLRRTDALCVGRTEALGTCSASSEPTRDFWISVSKVDRLLYPATNPQENFPAQDGVWLKLADNVRVYNVKDITGLFAISNTWWLDPNVRPKRW